MRCGDCKHFKRDPRKRFQRKACTLGWCECPLPVWCEPRGNDPERVEAELDHQCDCFAVAVHSTPDLMMQSVSSRDQIIDCVVCTRQFVLHRGDLATRVCPLCTADGLEP